MLLLYDVLMSLALLITSPYLLPKALLGGHGLKERLSFWPRDFFMDPDLGPILWIHAASVGEVHSLAAFLPVLSRACPEYDIILSVTSRAGRDRARQILDEIKQVFYLPVDISWLVNRVLRRANPEILLLAETELWPNLIIRARRRGTKVGLINGRMSPRSFSRYRLLKGLMARTLASLDVLCLQTEEDAQRFLALGARASKVIVTGNFKADLLAASHMRGQRDQVRSQLGIPEQAQVLVAGSTRPGEEEMILEGIMNLKESMGPLRTIIAPRHVKRAKKVTKLLEAGGLSVQRYSEVEIHPTSSWKVLVVDTMGQLMSLYSAADVAFVGGSLLSYGGHNPLEPASYGIPVLFGPHMEHCRRSAHLLLQAGGGIEVRDGPQLGEAISRLLHSEEERGRRGQAALQVVLGDRGNVERTAGALKEAIL